MKKSFREKNYEDLQILFERIRTRVNPSPISKEIRLEIFPNGTQNLATATMEFLGKQRNLHFENCKFFAAVFGILGVKITDFIYNPNNYYCRLDFIETDLLFRKDLARKERMDLIKENVQYMINFNRILEDKDDKHLWMKLAEDNMLFISFKSKQTFNKWLKTLENDLKNYGNTDSFLWKILLFFQKLHWIRIINEKDLSFQIDPILDTNGEQGKWLIKYLSKYTTICQNEDIYSLKN